MLGVAFACLSTASAFAWKDAPDGTTSQETRDEMRAHGQPVILKRVPPVYPKSAEKSGCVVVRMVVRKDGKADHFSVLNAVPEGVFEKTVLAALYLWEFEPVPVERAGSVTIKFIGGHTGRLPPDQRFRVCDDPVVARVSANSSGDPVVVRSLVTPYYPPEAVKGLVEGCVVLSFDITREGLADNYTVEAPASRKPFVDSVAWALNQWRFETPAKPARAAVAYRFSMKNEREEHAVEAPPACGVPQAYTTALTLPNATTP
jgi:TonB family protein